MFAYFFVLIKRIVCIFYIFLIFPRLNKKSIYMHYSQSPHSCTRFLYISATLFKCILEICNFVEIGKFLSTHIGSIVFVILIRTIVSLVIIDNRYFRHVHPSLISCRGCSLLSRREHSERDSCRLCN